MPCRFSDRWPASQTQASWASWLCVDRLPLVNWTKKPLYTAVSRKVVLRTGKTLRDNLESYHGQWWFLRLLLIEPQGVSAWWKETAQTHVFVLSRSLLLNHLEPQSSETFTTLNANRHCRVRFYRLLWDNLWRNSCILGKVSGWWFESQIFLCKRAGTVVVSATNALN